MNSAICSIRNLGPASEEFYGRAGLKTAEQIRTLGADAAYLRALKAGGQPHFIGYYALVMGLQGRPWNDCHGAEKARLKQRFTRLKAQAQAVQTGLSAIEWQLDKCGTGKTRD